MRFQYRVASLGMFRVPERMVRAFAQLGEAGWELVGVYDKSSNWLSQMEKGFAIFKRAVPDGEQPDGPWAKAEHADQMGADGSFQGDPW